MRTSNDLSSGKRIATIAIAAVIAASFAVPASAAHKKRYELMSARPAASAPASASAAFGSAVDPGRYPTYRTEGGCIEDQGNGRVLPCTSN
jgi:hypothetical protein